MIDPRFVVGLLLAMMTVTWAGSLSAGDPNPAPAWDAEWNRTVKAAEQEGQLVLYSLTEVGEAISNTGFQKKFPKIKISVVSARGGEHISRIMAERTLAHEKIKPVWDTVVTEVLDVAQGKVTGVRLKNLKTNTESTLDCAGLFVAIGHVPNTQLFKGIINMDEAGYITPVKGTATNVPGIFVAGDCSDSVYRQAITAAGMGCAAAIDCERYLSAMNE